MECYHNSKKGPVVDSKKNTLVLRGEVPGFAANKNAYSVYHRLVYIMYYLSYKIDVIWIQIGAGMCVSFFLIFKSKKIWRSTRFIQPVSWI